jgi:two-component system phosphate regulon sensor histidine kinase PhoR
VTARQRPGLLVGGATLAVALAGALWLEHGRHTVRHAEDIAALGRAVVGIAPRAEVLLSLSPRDADVEVRQWAAASGSRVTLIAADGRVHADSWTLPELLDRLENHAGRPELEAARGGQTGVAERRSATTDRTTIYVAHLLGGHDQPAGWVRIAREARTAGSPWGGLLAALAAALTAGLAAQRLEARLHRRVGHHLAAWSELPEAADLEARAEEADRRFRHEREVLTREVEVMRAAVGEVGEGVVLLDGEGTVRFANPAAMLLLGRGLAVGRPLVEAARAPELLAAVQETLATRATTHTTAAGLGGVELAVRSCALPHPVLAAAVVLRDTSGEKQLERARRALVADLAHELRTPLTVLGGVAEELREEKVDSTLVETVERQVRRLQAFAEELEELAAIESGRVSLAREEVDVLAAARAVAADVAAAATRGGVTVEVAGSPERVATDPMRLAQVLTNLADNAIRYNRPGGRVALSVAPHDGAVEIRVEDTGIGIPAAEVPLVFQRFYRVRRGPAAAEGGKGLGLAIVKHLVRALGGTVQLVSEEGKGTTVTVVLPTK